MAFQLLNPFLKLWSIGSVGIYVQCFEAHVYVNFRMRAVLSLEPVPFLRQGQGMSSSAELFKGQMEGQITSLEQRCKLLKIVKHKSYD